MASRGPPWPKLCQKAPPFATRRLGANSRAGRLAFAVLDPAVCYPLFVKMLLTHPDPRPMPATPDDLFAFLDRLGIAHPTVTHPPVFTVEEARALRGTVPGAHTKNLFLKDKKGALILVVALEDTVIELKSLHRLIRSNGRFSFGSAELLREALGVEPGAQTPFASRNDT